MMLKKVSFYTLLFLFAGVHHTYSQCPISVEIVPDKTGDLCRNTLVSFTAQPSGGVVNPEYYWVLGGDTLSTSATFATSVNSAYIQLYMESNSGCTQNNAIDDYNISTVSFSAESNSIEATECNQPVNDVEILGITGDGTPPYSYYLHTDTEDFPESSYYADLPISSYPLIVSDNAGCVDTTWVNVLTKECDPITPTQIFTPNDDGYNDTWIIQNIEDYPENKVYIFDRWGQRVFHKKGYENIEGWDAKYIGGNLAVSTFYYIIELEFEKQEKQVFKGPVSILR